MRNLSGILRGDFTASEDVTLLGELIGDLVVTSGVRVVLHGIVVGDLTVEAGSIVDLYGLVRGDVFDRGGRVNLYGSVQGVVRKGGPRQTESPPPRCVPDSSRAAARWQQVSAANCPRCGANPTFYANFCAQCGCDLRTVRLTA